CNNELSHHHKVPSVLDDPNWNDITEMINKMDCQPGMTMIDRMMAQFHKTTILTMRREMKNDKLIMRASYKGYSFHKYPAKEFQEKASNYMKKATIYKFLNEINPRNPTMAQNCLEKISNAVDTTLKKLLSSKAITDVQFLLMHPDLSNITLNYLYFVPDTTESEQPLEPIIICKNSPTFNVSNYISDLLWNMFNQITGCKKFTDSDEIVYILEQYAKDGLLRENTYFVTFNIHNVCTKFCHQEAWKALEKFLQTYRPQLEEIATNLTNDTIMELISVVLQNQYFIYDNKLYQQINGGPSGSLLTIPLAFLYLLYGQSTLLFDTLSNNKIEIFGRYRDDIFLTWNGSKEDFKTLMNGTMHYQQRQKPTIPSINCKIGKTIHLLDLELNNNNGHLITKIYRDPKTDEYELPSQYQYHTNQSPALLKLALKHTLHCCTNRKDFDIDQEHIRLSHLLRGFSSEFIDQCMKEFCQDLDIKSHFVHTFNTMPYETLRKRIMNNYEKAHVLQQEGKKEKQNMIRVPYPDRWPKEMALKIKDDLLNILDDHVTNDNTLRDIKFDFVPRPQTPLTINDYLVDKRPPLTLLTLPNNAQNQQSSNKEPFKTPSQDAQGRWYDLLSPTQVLTGQEQTTTTTTISNKKKKQSR
ncbi:unnamed protein product, partial [Rotaria sp. Silwood2]